MYDEMPFASDSTDFMSSNMSVDDAIGLSIKILKKISEEKLTQDHLDIGYVKAGSDFILLSPDKLGGYI